jgi:hypothetical protein
MIKIIKWWNKEHSSYMQSYHIEVLALRIFTGTFSNYAWHIYQFFKDAYDLTSNHLWYEISYADAYLTYSNRQEVLKRLRTARDKASAAWWAECDTNPKRDIQEAMRLWVQIFGDEFPAST